MVKEVLLRKVDLPEEYARGLAGCSKEQEDDRIKRTANRAEASAIAESQAEAARSATSSMPKPTPNRACSWPRPIRLDAVHAAT